MDSSLPELLDPFARWLVATYPREELERLRELADRPPYRPRGAAQSLRTATAAEIVLSGPAGTGKTRGCLQWLHQLALDHPRSRGLITRRTRNALTQTALVTFDDEVRPDLDGVTWHATKQQYRYPNGSVVVVGGMDDDGQKVFSGQYDHVYVNEATELSEPAWENLTTRLRNGRSPRPLIFGDCNPDRPTHWLYQRSGQEGSGKPTLRLESRHEDNPTLWDATAGDWTAEGRRYVLGILEALTGPRKERLRYGRWVQAEGVIYGGEHGWDRAVHLIDRFEIPQNWPRFWAIDFGFTNAFCCLFVAMDGDGRLYVYRQIYHTKRRVDEHAYRINAVSASVHEPRPRGCVADSADREGRETLAAHFISTVGSAKGPGVIRAGIQMIQRRLAKAADGKPRLFVLRDSLDERDPELAQSKRPTCLEEEVDGYVWCGRARDEPAPNQDDHALDALRYLVFALDAPRRREEDEDVTTVYVG